MKKYVLILVLIVLASQNAFSQEKKYDFDFKFDNNFVKDSTSIILSMGETKDKSYYLYKLGSFYFFSNSDSTIYYLKLAEKIAQSLNFQEILPQLHADLANSYGMMKSNQSIALYYNTLSKQEFENLKVKQAYPDFNIMMNYASMGSVTKTKKLLDKITPTVLAESYKSGNMISYVGMVGQIYNIINEQDSAIKYSQLALEFNQTLPVNKRWGYPYFVLAQIYLQKNEYQKSLNYIYSGTKYIMANGFEKDITQVYICAARAHYGLKNIDSAIYYSKLSYNLGSKIFYNDGILNSSQLLFTIYNEQNKIDSSFKYLQISSALKDTLASKNKVNDIDNITLNESIREQEKENQEKQKNRLIIGFTLFFIIGFSSFTIYNKQKQKERARKRDEERKNKELKAARDLQLSMLPKNTPQRTDLDIASFIRSSTEVGGDYYDFFEHKGTALYSICGDATGHGVASGMMVSVTKAGLNGIDALPANTILHKLNNVVKNIDLGTLRMSLNIVQIKSTEFELSSAAMPPVYHYVAASNKVEEILIKGLPLGGLREEHFDSITRSFNAGDIIIQLSDGLPEAPNLTGEMYDYERLRLLIESNGKKTAQGMIDTLMASVDEWLQGQHNPDDITLVVIKKK
jgi:sigma-B regulation protein RsbU (phosphoserine phosphatase)